MAERERTRVCYKCCRKLLKAETHDSVVYFISLGDDPLYVKIGVTSNLRKRLSQFQTGSPHGYTVLKTVLGSPDHEQALHQKFKHLAHKNEWFRLEPELLDFIASIADGEKLQLDALL